MERRWREYMGGPAVPSRNDIYATLNNKGEIIINRHAFEAMGRPEYAVMLFEPETNSVGVRAMEARVPNAFELQPKGNCDNRLIRAKSFCTDHEINFGCTVRFYAAEIENGVLLLELKKTVKATRKKRISKKRR